VARDCNLVDKIAKSSSNAILFVLAAVDEPKAKKLSVIEGSKRLAAWTAVDRHVLPHHKVSSPPPPSIVRRLLSGCSLSPSCMSCFG
jgi:hypothetical protein